MSNKNRFALSMAAMDREPVTQGHADYCAANGHAAYFLEGGAVDPMRAGSCPRCGHTEPQRTEADALDPQDAHLLAHMDGTPRGISALGARAGLGAGATLGGLSRLQSAGLVQISADTAWKRADAPAKVRTGADSEAESLARATGSTGATVTTEHVALDGTRTITGRGEYRR